jgi:hypothetical protein
MLDAEKARELLNYDPETGWLTYRTCVASRAIGDRAGSLKKGKSGYTRRQISLCGGVFLEHRIIFLIFTGKWPEGEIDHINNDATDNRWCNLRVVDRQTNNRNMQTESRGQAD